MQLGVETTTYDREGEVVARTDGPWPTRAELEKALSAFAGEIEQVPPPYSAVKQAGQAAYRRARRGEEVRLEPRRVSISRVELTSYEPPLVSLEVDCSAGTYLRSMAHDLGAALGTGGHLHELCRTRSGPFQLSQAITLDALEALGARGADRVIPMLAATGLPTFEIDARVARRVRNGVQLGRQEIKGAPPTACSSSPTRGVWWLWSRRQGAFPSCARCGSSPPTTRPAANKSRRALRFCAGLCYTRTRNRKVEACSAPNVGTKS